MSLAPPPPDDPPTPPTLMSAALAAANKQEAIEALGYLNETKPGEETQLRQRVRC